MTRSAFSASPSTTCRSRRGSARTGRVGPALQDEPDVGVGAPRLPHGRRVGRERGEVDRHGVEAEVVGLQPRQFHEVADEPVQPVGLADDHPAGVCGVGRR